LRREFEAAVAEVTLSEQYGAPNADPWQALVQVGVQLVAAMAAGHDPKVPARPRMEREPTRGERSVKVKLLPPQTVRTLANAPSALADSLRDTSP
jgi:hypothetical protein